MCRRLAVLHVVLLALMALAAPAAAAPSPDIVVSQVYGGGGNSGATLRDDFVELFNRGSSTVDVSSWSVQYASATGTTWQRTNLSGSIAPGQYYLVKQARGTGGSQDLPAPDATGAVAMSATAGKVALVANQTPLACGAAPGSCSAVPAVRDLIGYGATASDFERAPAPGTGNTTADLRNGGGCQETDDNAADFASGPPAPRNSASPANRCERPPADAAPTVTGTDPGRGAGEFDPAGNIAVTFSEPVDAADDAFVLTCTGSGDARPLSVSSNASSTTFTLDPRADLPRGQTCTLTVRAAGVSDRDGQRTRPSADSTTTFTTVGSTLRIHEIQGAQHRSPVEGSAVSGVLGVVTAVRRDGFYMQDPEPDADPKTSEGILVFSGRNPPPAAAAVGNAVRVSGRVTEFRPGGATGANLSTTEIVSPTVVAAGGGAIAPTVVGSGGRIPPSTVIDDDSEGDVETNFTFDPQQDGIDFYESLEGMLTEVRNAVAVGPTSDFGEIPVLADGGARAGVRTARGGIVIRPTDFNPERILLDDAIANDEPSLDVRDSFTAPVRAVVDYSFGNFKFLALAWPGTRDGGLQREVTRAPKPNQLAVASFNVENLDPGDPDEKFRRLAEVLVTNLRSPDLLALEEIQDDDGARSAAPTDASLTYERFIAAIKQAGGPTYELRQIDPVSNQDGGQPKGNIRVGFLFRTDRGLSFVDKPGGTAVNSTEEDGAEPGAQLTLSPGRIDPNEPAFERSRKPLAGEFRYRGRTLVVIANHFNSKGGDDPLFGRFQPPKRSSETQRHQQAAIVNRFVRELLEADARANVVVLGDLNDFEFSRTLDILEGRHDLYNLAETLPQSERYTYVFEGNSQVLDQILVSRSLLSPKPEYDSVHVNAEFADQVSDHDPQLARLRVTGAGR